MTRSSSTRRARPEPAGTLLGRLASRQLLFLTGKGGVGKSALTAALGLTLAEAGRRVLLLEVDPRESLYALLGIDPSGGEIVRLDDRIHLQNLQPRSVLDALVREQLGIELLSRRVLASPVYRHFAEGAPGLGELAVLGHAVRVVRGLAGDEVPQIDLVLLDAPATGHALSMLSAPRLVSEVIPGGPFGRLSQELAGFISDRRASGVIVATIAEEMPVQEAIELIQALKRQLDRRPDLVLVNELYPEPQEEVGQAESLDRLTELWLRRREVNDRELARLAAAWQGPRLDLPLLPLDRGPELVSALHECLLAGLGGAP